MSERPILFSSEMVRAILDGSKSATRRIIKPQPVTDGKAWACYWEHANHDGQYGPSAWGLDEKPCDSMLGHCPYGEVMERLWVRETFAETEGDGGPVVMYKAGGYLMNGATGDKRDGTWKEEVFPGDAGKIYPPDKWKPSIFMPRWASRLLLEITGVRVERLQEMSHKDALEEGVTYDVSKPDGSPLSRFQKLWESINGKGSWSANHWVWVVSFKRIEAKEKNAE